MIDRIDSFENISAQTTFLGLSILVYNKGIEIKQLKLTKFYACLPTRSHKSPNVPKEIDKVENMKFVTERNLFFK